LGVRIMRTHPPFSDRFNLGVYRRGILVELFENLSLVPGNNYVEPVINRAVSARNIEKTGSAWIRIEDLHSLSVPPLSQPSIGKENLSAGLQVLKLEGGRDGTAALRIDDFIGGLRLLEEVDELSIVAVPDMMIRPVPPLPIAPRPRPPAPDPCLPGQKPETVAEPIVVQPAEAAPQFKIEDIARGQHALISHCEKLRDRIAVLDAPLAESSSRTMDFGEIEAWRQRFDSSYAALYYPWIVVDDPDRTAGDIVRAIPPSGHVAGVFARTDRETGVHKAPANEELRWARAVDFDVSDEIQGLLNPIGINAIRPLPGRGIRIYGARTLSSNSLWRFVSVRRLLMMIEEAIDEAIQWTVFEPNNLLLRQRLSDCIAGFLETIWQRGALAGKTADEAFRVRCDSTTTPDDAAARGELIAVVMVAPIAPAEFVILRIGKTSDTLTIAELESAVWQ
jgi:hypothetical protein